MIDKTLKEYWDTPIKDRSVRKLCSKYWGTTDAGHPKFVSTVTSWVRSGYTTSNEIARSGQTLLGTATDSMLAGA